MRTTLAILGALLALLPALFYVYQNDLTQERARGLQENFNGLDQLVNDLAPYAMNSPKDFSDLLAKRANAKKEILDLRHQLGKVRRLALVLCPCGVMLMLGVLIVPKRSG